MSFTTVVTEELDFDIEDITANFRKCMAKNGCLYLDKYISGYHQLHNMLSRLGPVFLLLATDVRQKLVHLDCLRKGGAGASYSTVESMIDFETTGGILTEDRTGNGCRNLLRLNRTLGFVAELIRILATLSDEERLTPGCQAAYRRTLAPFHPWIAQKAALVAMYALGTRGETMLKLAPPSAQQQGGGLFCAETELTECADVLMQVRRQTDELLDSYQLTELP